MATTKIRITKGGGGGETPPAKGSVYTSQEEINKANEFARNFLMRKNVDPYFARNAIVASKIGDPKIRFETTGLQPAPLSLATELPMGVSVDDVVSTKGGYGFFHPQTGNFVPVDMDAILTKYKSAPIAKTTKLKISK